MKDVDLKLKSIGILGHFGFGHNLFNGQTIKTKIFTEELQRRFGNSQVMKIDTYGGWKNLVKAPFQVIHALKCCQNILIFPAHNGLRVYAPLLCFFRKYFRKRKLFYVVIGGWLPTFLEEHIRLQKPLKKFDGIWVETSSMKSDMDAMGFDNVYVVPNFKSLKSADVPEYEDFSKQFRDTVRFCTFSRVSKEKGIEDAVEAIKAANKHFGGKPKICLDIYGQVNDDYKERFDKLKSGFPEYISYKGIVSPGESVDVLKNYYALLFPTHYYTEGIPGTLIDALFAAVPVITTKWKNCGDIFEENTTGWSYEFGKNEMLIRLVIGAVEHKDEFYSMKSKTLKYSEKFSVKNIISVIEHLLNN